MKKTLKIVLLSSFLLILMCSTCFAEYSFTERDYDIDSIDLNYPKSDESKINEYTLMNLLLQVIGFNNIYTPFLLIGIYIIFQIYFIKKYKKIRQCLLINLVIILLICTINKFINSFIIDWSSEVISITSCMYITNSFIGIKIANIIINSLLLIIGLVYQKKVIKKYDEEKLKKFNSKTKRNIIVLLAILILLILVDSKSPKMHTVEVDWSFGYTFDKRTYDTRIIIGKNIGSTKFKVLEIDDEGVLIEYTRGYYEENNKSNKEDSMMNPNIMLDYSYKEEIVQQKMKWNTNYSYNQPSDPMLCTDGGTDYYVRFEK